MVYIMQKKKIMTRSTHIVTFQLVGTQIIEKNPNRGNDSCNIDHINVNHNNNNNDNNQMRITFITINTQVQNYDKYDCYYESYCYDDW